LTNTEQIPFAYDGGIEAFFEKEIKPYAKDAWIDRKQTKIGYEISFARYFYKPIELRPLEEITADIKALEDETKGLLEKILED
jgi:type I restriction enzyme M protein